MLSVNFQNSGNARFKSPFKAQLKIMTAAALLSAAMLGGCANSSRDHFIVGSTPDDYRTRHPIVVSESEISEDIPVSANMRKMSFRDLNLVASVARRFRRSGGHSIQVMVPSQSMNEVAARKISRQIVSALLEKGVKRSQISMTSYHAGGHSSVAPIRVSFIALAANVGECGKWKENIIADADNRQYGNFGCATQNNLAQMIANPADLLGPRGESPINAARRGNVIADWQNNGSGNLSRQF